MKSLTLVSIFSVLFFSSCKTAFISSYTFPEVPARQNCFYQIETEESTFAQINPVTASADNMELINGEWVTHDDEYTVGYALSYGDRTTFQYLLEQALNQNGNVSTCGHIIVHRLQHQAKRDIAPGLSLLTLFIPNIFGLPIRSNKVENSYLIEVYDPDSLLIYRGVHSGQGKAKCGLYYGFKNSDEKADWDATSMAISEFLSAFNN